MTRGQLKPGQTGNARGRPNVQADVARALARYIQGAAPAASCAPTRACPGPVPGDRHPAHVSAVLRVHRHGAGPDGAAASRRAKLIAAGLGAEGGDAQPGPDPGPPPPAVPTPVAATYRLVQIRRQPKPPEPFK